MVHPERPQADEYDDNEQVARHFSKTPGLTKLPWGYRYQPYNTPIKAKLHDLYRKYNFELCPHSGLFWAGHPSEILDKDRDKTLLLVVELKAANIKDWWKIDGEVRELLASYHLSGRHGVCVRYYQYCQDDVYDAEAANRPARDTRERTYDARRAARIPTARIQTARIPAARMQAARRDSAVGAEAATGTGILSLDTLIASPFTDEISVQPTIPTMPPPSTISEAARRFRNATNALQQVLTEDTETENEIRSLLLQLSRAHDSTLESLFQILLGLRD